MSYGTPYPNELGSPPPYDHTLVGPALLVPSPMHCPAPGAMHIPISMPTSPGPGSPYPQNPFQHYSFGPTPINVQRPTYYAYYDPRSPYSIEQAGIRARQRFFEALFWAVTTWCLIGFLIGSSAVHILDSLQ